ncbi:DNA mismatch repair protein MutL [Clostridium acetobutylicum]|uniref:DNA mismatch repair protein MutL n=1 Tax=Clostridium acetobutylicum (strain ATCC 824 / DSM 792 / JCM 1419 / IAM 19013 / LMG 5710 / NBRC 13948 / NRRL B-527 / VKM B-1787 / 2291 / W) TaxID=272562 RepID=MUTL_CLOAB|nr:MULTISPECIES: DNA mismatch repair endonuclease MutL [Clostridium]Q97I20.1 RecName: Full=DNA mismatch repair protein MutL [Clostridium acetobutylicum ATCC 824]AAK79800.1 DNA mismatch repair enzyme, MutL [Clostridium acetobutylicum ATCC 824]ADZ20886.1 DNA mismatch repair protein [Clostridium acetobutylicum EA 2018]AEI33151.1 DNA mismatch repair protein [Clostridium acetobutylicum DSM 1731]AWV79765.1 DNA mismatch repair endonuclease MutL [Clostridium acetobutylicum]MBC2394253.1 DNA mismatch r
MRINILSEDTSNKIAAGEVVERPFSVVKELVENSIDAGAKTINIEIENGGRTLIKVLDDGYGIDKDDIEKAFMPHATSKISKLQDIYSINTLGFRGEALPSIASVSKTTLKSRTKENEFGREISISGGSVDYIKDCGTNIGTHIEVRDLFYNVPAREKFLKSTAKEASSISDIVNRLALAHSEISFRLINNGKRVITTYATDNLIDTIRAIYGKKICDNVISFERHTDLVSVHGYVGNAEISRGSRNNQSIFINKRYIKNKLITAAVENAVKSFMMINKFPFFIIFLDIFPEFVDVNVHPTKSEVKFQNERDIFKIIFDTVHEGIRNSLKESFKVEALKEEEDKLFDIKEDVITKNEIKHDDKIDGYIKKDSFPVPVQIPIDLKRPIENYDNSTKENKDRSFDDFREKDIIKETSQEKETYDIITNKKAKFPELRVIGQFNNTYILAESFEELYIIDQHAAHEKILFEKYREDIKNKGVSSQILITPSVVELLPEDFIYYDENKEVFKNAGFVIEYFGDNTVAIKEVPLFLGKPLVKDLFLEIIDNLKNMGSGETSEVKYRSIATAACKSAVKAYHELTHDEMKTLIQDLRFAEDPFNCPHGRPTIVRLTVTDFEKKFKRIQ